MLARRPLLLAMLLTAVAPPARAGYSHYWEWQAFPDDARLGKCVAEMRRVIEARAQTLDVDPPSTPARGPFEVGFNGRGADAHEPFRFPGRPGFNFCKTQWKPYDEVVIACLLVARDHFGPDALAIRSDGAWEAGAWADGASLYTRTLGRPAKDPTTPRPAVVEDAPRDAPILDDVDYSSLPIAPADGWNAPTPGTGVSLAISAATFAAIGILLLLLRRN